MIIPPERLPVETLDNLLEEFITREGTDYGWEELTLDQKRNTLKDQLKNNTVIIWFDTATESAQIITQEQYREWSVNNAQSASGGEYD